MLSTLSTSLHHPAQSLHHPTPPIGVEGWRSAARASDGSQPIAPTEAEILTDEIRAVCHQIDRRLDNRPGTAERGLYFWLWPPADLDADVLTRLHADAIEFLHNITTTEGTAP